MLDLYWKSTFLLVGKALNFGMVKDYAIVNNNAYKFYNNLKNVFIFLVLKHAVKSYVLYNHNDF